jgi:hypothetical protein
MFGLVVVGGELLLTLNIVYIRSASSFVSTNIYKKNYLVSFVNFRLLIVNLLKESKKRKLNLPITQQNKLVI